MASGNPQEIHSGGEGTIECEHQHRDSKITTITFLTSSFGMGRFGKAFGWSTPSGSVVGHARSLSFTLARLHQLGLG